MSRLPGLLSQMENPQKTLWESSGRGQPPKSFVVTRGTMLRWSTAKPSLIN